MPLDRNSELFILVDDQDHELGTVTRGEAHQNNSLIHRGAFILVTRKRGEKKQLLLQQRSLQKDLYPGYWSLSVGGHVSPGESYLQAAQREMREEIHEQANLHWLTKILLKSERETEFDAIFEAVIKSSSDEFDRDEISSLEWVDIDQLTSFFQSHPTYNDVIKVLQAVGYLPIK